MEIGFKGGTGIHSTINLGLPNFQLSPKTVDLLRSNKRVGYDNAINTRTDENLFIIYKVP
jgi:hypothetical protein